MFFQSAAVVIFCAISVTEARILRNARIVGGADAQPNEFPWQVFICYSESQNRNACTLPCGGSLISDDVVLTAKHCLPTETGLQNYRIFAGSNHLMEGEQRGIKQIIFNSESDTALVVLNSKFDMSNIKTIAVANAGQPVPVGLNATATGWGQMSCIGDNPDFAQTLQKIIIPILPSSFSQCKPYTNDHRFCAGLVDMNPFDPYYGVWYGDSGGPLAARIGSKWELIGVTSYAIAVDGKYCTGPKVSFYENVAYIRLWIDEQLEHLHAVSSETTTATSNKVTEAFTTEHPNTSHHPVENSTHEHQTTVTAVHLTTESIKPGNTTSPAKTTAEHHTTAESSKTTTTPHHVESSTIHHTSSENPENATLSSVKTTAEQHTTTSHHVESSTTHHTTSEKPGNVTSPAETTVEHHTTFKSSKTTTTPHHIESSTAHQSSSEHTTASVSASSASHQTTTEHASTQASSETTTTTPSHSTSVHSTHTTPETSTHSGSTTSGAGYCPAEWMTVEDLDSCYTVIPEKTNEPFAAEKCKILNGHLTLIDSAHENQVVELWIKNMNLTEAWISLKAETCKWEWTQNIIGNYSHWASGQPENICAVITNEGWKAKLCNDIAEGFVCEMPKQPKPGTTTRPVPTTEEPAKCTVDQFCVHNGALIGGSSRKNLTEKDCQVFPQILPGVQAVNDIICVETKCFHQQNWVIFGRKSNACKIAVCPDCYSYDMRTWIDGCPICYYEACKNDTDCGIGGQCDLAMNLCNYGQAIINQPKVCVFDQQCTSGEICDDRNKCSTAQLIPI